MGPENIFEYYPAEPFDAAVLCCVLEPYPVEMWRIMFAHVYDFLNSGGLLVFVVSATTSRPVACDGIVPVPSATGSLDLSFPAACESMPVFDEVEDELTLVGFDVDVPELLKTSREQPADNVATLTEASERQTFTVM